MNETQHLPLASSYGVIHAVASCRDCDWVTESYKNAQALAAQHARRYRHHVEGEVTNAFAYAPAFVYAPVRTKEQR